LPVFECDIAKMDHRVVVPTIWVHDAILGLDMHRSKRVVAKEAARVEFGAKLDEQLEVVKALDRAALELLTPPAREVHKGAWDVGGPRAAQTGAGREPERHHIAVNAPEEGTIVVVYLLWASIVGDHEVASDVPPRHLCGRLAGPHSGEEWLAVPWIDRPMVRRLTARVEEHVLIDRISSTEAVVDVDASPS
jgi:hypothetical protein